MGLSPLSFPIFSDKLIIYSLHRICKERGDRTHEEKEGEISLGSRGFPIYIIGFSLLLAGGAPEWLETVSKIMIALGVILLIIAGIDLKKRKNQYKPKKLPNGSFFI
ncbi:hypothetical protein MUB16_21565 [Priestia sp. OVL9]|nr:hypothetical protein [Priestia sp. OVL9]